MISDAICGLAILIVLALTVRRLTKKINSINRLIHEKLLNNTEFELTKVYYHETKRLNPNERLDRLYLLYLHNQLDHVKLRYQAIKIADSRYLLDKHVRTIILGSSEKYLNEIANIYNMDFINEIKSLHESNFTRFIINLRSDVKKHDHTYKEILSLHTINFYSLNLAQNLNLYFSYKERGILEKKHTGNKDLDISLIDDLLKNHYDIDTKKELVLIKNAIKRTNQNYRKGILTQEEYNRQIQQHEDKILDFIYSEKK